MEIVMLNSLSLNMVPKESNLGTLTYRKFDNLREVVDYCLRNTVIESAIGHVDTDNLLRGMFASEGCSLPVGKRTNITLDPTKQYIVAQYVGPRLVEGAASLPDGARLEFYLVQFADLF